MRAPAPLQAINDSTEGRRIAKRHAQPSGSTTRGLDPHTTFEVAAGWPPLRAPEASGCALLVNHRLSAPWDLGGCCQIQARPRSAALNLRGDLGRKSGEKIVRLIP
jgi:hypothetical protein